MNYLQVRASKRLAAICPARAETFGSFGAALSAASPPPRRQTGDVHPEQKGRGDGRRTLEAATSGMGDGNLEIFSLKLVFFYGCGGLFMWISIDDDRFVDGE